MSVKYNQETGVNKYTQAEVFTLESITVLYIEYTKIQTFLCHAGYMPYFTFPFPRFSNKFCNLALINVSVSNYE